MVTTAVVGVAAAVAVIGATAMALRLDQAESPLVEPAPSVPLASVGPASDVTSTEATLSGSIDSVSLADLTRIEFSVRRRDGSARVVPARVVVDGSSLRAEARLGRLRPGTEYIYALRVELDGPRVVDSDERSFRTRE